MSRFLILGLTLPALVFYAGCERPLAQAEYVSADGVAKIRKKLDEGAPVEDPNAVKVVAKPTGWFNLKGTFTMQTVPPRKTIAMCMPGNKPVISDRLVVDPSTKGVRDVLVYLTTKAGPDPEWEHSSYAESKEATVEFDQKDCVFLSHTFAMRSTQKLKILNSDPFGHNTNIPAKSGMTGTNPTVPATSFVIYEPGGEASEPTGVGCSIHPYMSANLIARNNPYFAVTKPDGTFEIANIPAGVDLEFRVWHESLGTVKEATGLTFKSKKLIVKAADGENIEWTVELSPPK